MLDEVVSSCCHAQIMPEHEKRLQEVKSPITKAHLVAIGLETNTISDPGSFEGFSTVLNSPWSAISPDGFVQTNVSSSAATYDPGVASTRVGESDTPATGGKSVHSLPLLEPIECADWCADGDGHAAAVMRGDQVCWGFESYTSLALDLLAVDLADADPTRLDRVDEDAG